MPITNHVTSLELSRRLKELKVPQKSYFVWKPLFENKKEGKWRVSTRAIHAEKYDGELVSAYLASELGDMIYKNHKLMVCPNWEDRGVYRMQYDLQWWCEGKTLADVYAKMLIYLLENHLISVEELGK